MLVMWTYTFMRFTNVYTGTTTFCVKRWTLATLGSYFSLFVHRKRAKWWVVFDFQLKGKLYGTDFLYDFCCTIQIALCKHKKYKMCHVMVSYTTTKKVEHVYHSYDIVWKSTLHVAAVCLFFTEISRKGKRYCIDTVDVSSMLQG